MKLATRPSPAPLVSPETVPFWQAARRGELLIRRCRDCGEAHYFPRSLCPFCFGETDWERTSGKGTIYSFSVMTKSEQPYAIAYIKLDEGPILMTNIVDTHADAIAIGGRVALVFRKTTDDGAPLPMFTPEG